MNCFLHGSVGHHKDWAKFINSIPNKNGFAPNLYKYVNMVNVIYYATY